MKRALLLLATTSLTMITPAASAQSIEELKQQIAALAKKVEELEKKTE